jgi:hypothetical protein
LFEFLSDDIEHPAAFIAKIFGFLERFIRRKTKATRDVELCFYFTYGAACVPQKLQVFASGGAAVALCYVACDGTAARLSWFTRPNLSESGNWPVQWYTASVI